MNSAVVTDWFSAQRRLEEKVAKAKAKRDAAEFAHAQAERELEALKAKRRAAEGL